MSLNCISARPSQELHDRGEVRCRLQRMRVGELAGPPHPVAGLDLHLDRAGGRVRDSVMDAVRDAIRSGRLVSGTRLPSSRALAADLGVARNTVARAYAELIAEGWLTSQHGSGTLVSQRAEQVVRSVASPPGERAPRRLDHDLRPGHPDLSSFPRAEWGRAVKRALDTAPFEAFGYTDTYGRTELRGALAQYLARARGVEAAHATSSYVAGPPRE